MTNDMTVRIWMPAADYPLAVGWWRGHNCAEEYIPLPQYLPRSGFVVEQAGRALCMGWLLYFMDIPAAQTGYIVTSPENTPAQSAGAIAVLLSDIGRLADRQQVRLIARYDHKGILNVMKSLGWSELVSGQTEMIRYPATDGLQTGADKPTKEVSEGGP